MVLLGAEVEERTVVLGAQEGAQQAPAGADVERLVDEGQATVVVVPAREQDGFEWWQRRRESGRPVVMHTRGRSKPNRERAVRGQTKI